MPVFSPKQSLRLAATLYSPPETWISSVLALRNGMMPGSSRCTRAPRARKSSSLGSVRRPRLLMAFPNEGGGEDGRIGVELVQKLEDADRLRRRRRTP